MRTARLALAATALLAVTVPMTAGPGGAQVPQPDPIHWAPCEDDQLRPDLPIDCTTFRVPMDHADPAGPELEVFAMRAPATNPDNRIGSLYFNPGGPGVSAALQVAGMSVALDGPIRERFDLIGMDPRGVGRSAPAPSCESEEPHLPSPLEVGWDAYFDQALADTRPKMTACSVSVARYGSDLGTNQVVEDLEWLRRANGDEEMNYWGVSYGTRLGEAYAQRHGHNVRAMLLDGNVDPHSTVTSFAAERGGAKDDAFDLFAETFPTAGEQFDDIYQALVSGTDSEWQKLRQMVDILGVVLAAENLWPQLVDQIAEWHDQLPSGELTVDGDPGAMMGGANMGTVMSIVNCIDLPGKPTPEEMPALAEQMSAEGPYFGKFLVVALLLCEGLVVEEDPVPAVSPTGIGPVLTIGSVHDPATPYVWSEAMHDFLGGSELLTYGGAQHGARLGPSDCIAEHADEYLVSLTLPPPDTVCAFIPPEL